MLAEVTVSASAAEKVKSEVQKVKDRAQLIVDEIEADKAVATVKLEAAKPALQQAERALQTIKVCMQTPGDWSKLVRHCCLNQSQTLLEWLCNPGEGESQGWIFTF